MAEDGAQTERTAIVMKAVMIRSREGKKSTKQLTQGCKQKYNVDKKIVGNYGPLKQSSEVASPI